MSETAKVDPLDSIVTIIRGMKPSTAHWRAFSWQKEYMATFFPLLPVSSYPVQPLQLRSLAQYLVSLTCQQQSSVLVWLFYLVNWNNLPLDVLTYYFRIKGALEVNRWFWIKRKKTICIFLWALYCRLQPLVCTSTDVCVCTHNTPGTTLFTADIGTCCLRDNEGVKTVSAGSYWGFRGDSGNFLLCWGSATNKVYAQ